MAKNESSSSVTIEEPTRYFKFTYRYLLLDLSLRWVVLGVRQFDLINDWIFWIAQAIAIPALVLYLSDKRSTEVADKYGLKAGKAQPKDTTGSVLFGLFAVLLGTYISYSLYPWRLWVRIIFAVATLLVYGCYVLAVYVFSLDPTPVDNISGISEAEEVLTDQEWRDENDRAIIELETDKISLSHKVEAYTLESALFGALAFSGFVTIVASEKPVLDGVQRLLADGLALIKIILRFDFSTFDQVFTDLTIEHTLLAAIATQTLISAVFFLSVIISRLRFNDVMRRVELSTRLASSYNSKEEELLNFSFQTTDQKTIDLQEEKLKELKPKISQATFYAEQSMKDLVPVVRYMSVFRNLGVISFLLILITSALWVSRFLAIVFTVLSLLAYVYPFLDKLIRDRKLSSIRFFQKGKRFFPHLRIK